MEPKIEENIKRIEDQQSLKPQTPAAPYLPDPQIAICLHKILTQILT